MGKDAIKHSHSFISNIGNGSNVGERRIIATGAGDRSLDGGTTTIMGEVNLGTLVQVATIVKYLNITLQAAVRVGEEPQNEETQGWLEWAVVFRNETDKSIPSTNLGTKTLADIATSMFRGDCLMTGAFPVSHNLPNIANITLKLPKKAVKWKVGSELNMYTFFRDADVTVLATDSVRLVQQFMFKAYN